MYSFNIKMLVGLYRLVPFSRNSMQFINYPSNTDNVYNLRRSVIWFDYIDQNLFASDSTFYNEIFD